MEVYREFVEPSRVSHSVGCHFISPHSKHLVVAKCSLLQIFEVVHNPQACLKLVLQFKLHGLITGLKAIRTVENPSLDYLLVSTRFAKFSLIKWNHHFHTINTVSLHYYENAIQAATFEKLSYSELLLEPTYHSLACLRHKNILAFLPFQINEDDDEEEDDDVDHYDDKDDDENKELSESNKPKTSDSLDIGPNQPLDIFGESFLLDAQALDPSIGTLVDVQFLHNYREPTIALLSLKSPVWAGTLGQQKDNIQFMVLTLDVGSRMTVLVLKVENLPYDVDTIIPLAPPLNGCLLMGANEVIHVDNAGIVRRIAVNQYTSSITASTKNYIDQSSLNLKLEGSKATQLPGDHRVLLIITTGDFFHISFKVDGQSVKGLAIEPIDKALYPDTTIKRVTTAALLGQNLIFLGNQSGDAPLLHYTYQENVPLVKGEDETRLTLMNSKDDMDDDDDDDLYRDDDDDEQNGETNLTDSQGPGHHKAQTHTRNCAIAYATHDRLVGHGPISNITMAYGCTQKYVANLIHPNWRQASIVASCGEGSESKLLVFSPTIQPQISSSLTFSQVNRMWTINRQYLITSDDSDSKSEIFQINKKFARLTSKDFINNEPTILMHELDNGKYILQITPNHINVYDDTFALKMTLSNEINEDEILNSNVKDEFLMVFLSNGDVRIFSINTYNQSYATISIPKLLDDTIITSGYITNSCVLNAVLKDVSLLLKDRGGVKRRASERLWQGHDTPQPEPESLKIKVKTFVLVTGDNRIVAFTRFHNQRCYQLNDVANFTNHLSLGFFEPTQTEPDPFIKQVILNDLGDSADKQEYLTILTVGGEVLLYRLYYDGSNYRFIKEKDIEITGAPENAYPLGTTIERRLAYFSDLNGLTCIFVTGLTPYLILKVSHSIPRVYRFCNIAAASVAPYFDSKIKAGLVFLDLHKNARICELPLDFNYENAWPVRQIAIGELIKSVTYHEHSNTFVLLTLKTIPYKCLDEEGEIGAGVESDKPSALLFRGAIRLLSPLTWLVIDSVDMKDNEVGMSVKSVILDMGLSMVNSFRFQKELVVVGTGQYRTEDLTSNGSIKILDIVDVIPEPGRPETNRKLKVVFEEDTRGAVTALCGVSGRILMAQGQKVIVRDLKDDGAVPVAFLDTSVYVSEAKSFGNLLLLGDSLKSVCLVGFDADPFRMLLLGKDVLGLDIACADFIVRDEQVFFAVADANCVLHIVQYDPDDPASQNGQRLVMKSLFATNLQASAFISLPRAFEGYDIEKRERQVAMSDSEFLVIGATVEGLLFSIVPVAEDAYRRMYIIQQQLTDKEYHDCGLNPRMNRYSGLEMTSNEVNAKPMLDYDLIRQFAKMGNDRRVNFASKLGSRSVYQEIWRDILDMEHLLYNW